MTDQNRREWPSFNDILEELDTLGGLSVAPSTPSASEFAVADTADSDADSDWAFDAGELFDSVEELDVETEIPEIPEPEIEAPAAEVPEADPFGGNFEAPTPFDVVTPSVEDAPAFGSIVPETAVPELDWSSWEFQPEADDSAGDVFQFDTADLEPEPAEESEPQLDESNIGKTSPDAQLDSVATADQIESDLQELFSMVEVDGTEASQLEIEEQTEAPALASDLASLEDLTGADPSASDLAAAVEAIASEGDKPDNVVPLHPDASDYTDDVVGLDGAFDPARPQPVEPVAASEFVGVEQDENASDDRWDYLRPGDDESSAGSFWSKRRNFFGGDERKAKKANRRQSDPDESLAGPPCPKCGSAGNIDLDDPIGGKLHLSCHECDHVWSQLAEARPESA